MRLFRPVVSLAPGIALSSAVALGGYALAFTVQRVTGRMPVDALVWCIVLGTLVKSLFILPAVVNKGIHLCAKTVLELAIVLLGASVSISQIAGSGFTLIAWVIAVLCCGLVSSYVIGRVIGLPHPLALLVACGNSICGNSAIMAAAPVIGADADEVASSIAFTALLGILVVLLLPLVAFQAGLDPRHYGILAGMTVYAVPQVLAATTSFGLVSLQIGTLVKLIRVMMLGPVLLGLGVGVRGMERGTGRANEHKIERNFSFAHLAPWFIIGFLALMVARSLDALPHGLLEPSQHLSGFLTTLSMAALGLQVDLRSLLASGGRVLAAGSLSILALGAIALTAIHFMA
ncbi:putative sulfate exporter family transporter [Agrobacterium vitis]|uniref:YeiH family protein n=1 Tax=Agrobacterium vitis TaxID=373 RepID=UPI0008724177|nr:putative sulfate exporter family transporter [Agrobacterium vitis]MCE6073447.1 putative sulfate exporter family transporter [Agrobacterium vitis]MCF1467594.1 putative sulfate exporter family transporter [Agrobacterium vitis]MCM2452673.1 putative sulfate exporter family transporter [Agrobacterium vitis]MCM2469378.1 putative sulfate exporter family transporter [Agrobacterium vitis]MUO69148.1 putative sulfate exporter family transporter [Agrobacterium vitis]